MKKRSNLSVLKNVSPRQSLTVNYWAQLKLLMLGIRIAPKTNDDLMLERKVLVRQNKLQEFLDKTEISLGLSGNFSVRLKASTPPICSKTVFSQEVD